MKLLIKFEKDWADEFDVYGLAIMTEEEWLAFQATIPEMVYSFGTNEGWEEPGEIDEDDFEASPITEAEETSIRQLLFRNNRNTYGNFPS